MITRKPCGCVCLGDCIVAEDDFNRADSESPGTGWTEEAGDADIVDEQLEIVGANAAIIHDGEYPGVGSLGFYQHPGAAEATAYSDTEGAEGIIYGAWLDADNHHYARWTFHSDHALLRFFRVDGGSLDAGSGEFYIPGRGVGVATRLRFCWQEGALTVSSDDFDGPLTSVSTAWNLHIGGNRAGVGTGAVGGVTFDDYLGTKTSPSACGRCQRCGHCSDTQQICVTVSGMEDLVVSPPSSGGFQFSLFNLDEQLVLTRSTTGCAWGQSSPALLSTYGLIPPDPGDDWILRGRFIISGDGIYAGRTATATFEANLGPGLPNCAAWDCVRLYFVGCDIPDVGDCAEWTENAIVSVSSGATCCYYYYYDGGDLPPEEGTCCEERREGEGMPGTVYATLYNPYTGDLIAEDVPLDIDPTATNGFRYVGDLGTHPEGCDTSVTLQCTYLPEEDPPIQYTQLDYFARNTLGNCVGASILIRNIGCDPYHGVPDPEVLEGEWDGVEIIE